ncbi:anti-repressor SinI family protein [Priestia megaterium]|nr:anti-repressor SinI family protein [Priestia megaterium]MCY9023213.1 anti-repressor SinI family protein [Priestia megaterium]
MTDKSAKKVGIDKEWILLMEEAFKMGLSVSQIKNFIKENKYK